MKGAAVGAAIVAGVISVIWGLNEHHYAIAVVAGVGLGALLGYVIDKSA